MTMKNSWMWIVGAVLVMMLVTNTGVFKKEAQGGQTLDFLKSKCTVGETIYTSALSPVPNNCYPYCLDTSSSHCKDAYPNCGYSKVIYDCTIQDQSQCTTSSGSKVTQGLRTCDQNSVVACGYNAQFQKLRDCSESKSVCSLTSSLGAECKVVQPDVGTNVPAQSVPNPSTELSPSLPDSATTNPLLDSALKPLDTNKVTATQIPILYTEINQVTDETIMSSACKLDENCLEFEDLKGDKNYTVKCKSTSQTKDLLDKAVKNKCDFKIGKFLTGIGIGGVGLCVGGLLLSPGTFGTSALVACGLASGAIVATAGGTEMALEAGCAIIKNTDGKGMCIATPNSQSGFCLSWADQLASSLGMNFGCSSNTIIVIIALLMIIALVFSKV